MSRPSASVLAVFALVVLMGGSNFVAVRFSNRELPPFWAAGARFALASLVFFAIAYASRTPLPRGRALAGALAFGAVNFGASYAFAYWGLLGAPSALAATLVALVPLMTLVLAVALGMERLRLVGVLGALVALAGVAVVFADQLHAVPFASLAALVLQAVSIAVATVMAKRLPRAHPIATNAVATVPGALLLLALSFVAGETRALPAQMETWLASAYLVASTIALFAGFLFIVIRWTASAASYATVLFPIVTVALGALLAGEMVTVPFVVGALLVMLGTYLGALAQPASAASAPPAPRASSASRP